MPYSNADISGFIGAQGIGGNPWAIYGNAQRYGVTGTQLDQAMGWGAGTADNWVRQNGLQGLSGTPNLGQYGYGNGPGGQRGYYEQQTPVGSFAAADQQRSQGAAPAQQQWAANPFIGQQSQGISGAQSVMPWAQQAARVGQAANPFLGQQAAPAQQVGANPYAGSNPFLGQAIDAASQDAIRNYNTAIRPQLDSMGRASGSFGNSAIQELQQNAMGDLGRNLGNIASGMRMQDYTQQQQLGENALGRQQQTNMFNAGLGAQDLARNVSGFNAGQGLGLQGLGMALGGAQFDATLGNNVSQFNAGLSSGDLNRNAQLAQGLSTFNAGQGNALNQFNANLGQQNNQFNAGQGNALNQFNSGQGNQMLSQWRNLNQQQNQFDRGLDFNTWRANNDLQRQGTQDQIDLVGRMLGWNSQALNLANQQQMTPLQIWQQLASTGAQLGGMGGSTAQNLQGNPWLGALGGWLAANQFNGWR